MTPKRLSFLKINNLHFVAGSIILIVLIFLFLYGYRHDFAPFDKDLGETYLAVRQGKYFQETGFRYGLLENLGTIEDPLLYTHNVNLGGLTYSLLEAVGIHSFSVKQIFTIFVFCAGLWLIYLTVYAYSQSYLAALVVLILFSIDYSPPTISSFSTGLRLKSIPSLSLDIPNERPRT